jgi:hypothetical protein
MKLRVSLLAFVLLCPALARAQSYSFDFESGMQGWVADGTDLDHAGGFIKWWITRSTARATSGIYSVEYFLDNRNDKGKIWIERAFGVVPSASYRVSVAYRLASRIQSPIGAFTIITGASPKNPEVAGDLTYQGNTANGGVNGWVWLSKSYNLNARSDATGRLYVSIGVWGTWEVPHTYYVDDVNIGLTRVYTTTGR